MTEGEWMGDRWSMMLSLKKKLMKKRRECFSLFVILSFSPFLYQKRKRTAKVIRTLLALSLSLLRYLKQINLISPYDVFLPFFSAPSLLNPLFHETESEKVKTLL